MEHLGRAVAHFLAFGARVLPFYFLGIIVEARIAMGIILAAIAAIVLPRIVGRATRISRMSDCGDFGR